jgi:hypothetical protein
MRQIATSTILERPKNSKSLPDNGNQSIPRIFGDISDVCYIWDTIEKGGMKSTEEKRNT